MGTDGVTDGGCGGAAGNGGAETGADSTVSKEEAGGSGVFEGWSESGGYMGTCWLGVRSATVKSYLARDRCPFPQRCWMVRSDDGRMEARRNAGRSCAR